MNKLYKMWLSNSPQFEIIKTSDNLIGESKFTIRRCFIIISVINLIFDTIICLIVCGGLSLLITLVTFVQHSDVDIVNIRQLLNEFSINIDSSFLNLFVFFTISLFIFNFTFNIITTLIRLPFVMYELRKRLF